MFTIACKIRNKKKPNKTVIHDNTYVLLPIKMYISMYCYQYICTSVYAQYKYNDTWYNCPCLNHPLDT